MTGTTAQRILLAAGGTGGHLFPAQALAEVLTARGYSVDLVTDTRGGRYDGDFPAGDRHVVPSDTIRGSGPVAYLRTAAVLALGVFRALKLIGRLRPSAVVGFGGYPTIPPLIAARLRRVPTLIHEQNAVMGRANRLLAGPVDAIAASFPTLERLNARHAAKVVRTGAPVRAAVTAAATDFKSPGPRAKVRLLVFGGSQGARIFSEVVPAAIAGLDEALRKRLAVVQQCREEDIEGVRKAYADCGVSAELAAFFPDLPRRMAQAHLVISRAGASTVAELAIIGRPAILVPLPHALDDDQLRNATAMVDAGGGWLMPQSGFTPTQLGAALTARLAEPAQLAEAAIAARELGSPRAAEALAAAVIALAEGQTVSRNGEEVVV